MRARRLMSVLALPAGLAMLGATTPAWAVDSDGDGVDNAVDVCNNTPLGTMVDSNGRPVGDSDLDCDTDLEDFALFQQGFTGDSGEYELFHQGLTGPLGFVVIDTVSVGNPGNAADTRYETPGYGGVDYVYNIGRFEVTAGQYRDFLNAVDPAGSNPYGLYNSLMDSRSRGCQITWNPGSSTYDFSGRPSGTEADWSNRPVNYVSWGDGARFANWLHNGQPTGQATGDPIEDAWLTEDGSYHLDGATSNAALMLITREADATWVIPSEDEWYKAAYHKNDGVTGNYFDYPTSSNGVPGYVNDSGNLSGTGAPFTEGGTDPGDYATYDGDNGIDGIGSPYYRTQVGEWENSDSPYGTSDQGGNVWERNEAVVGPYRGLRGGSFDVDVNRLHASTRNYLYYPTQELDIIGFRVAEVP